MVPDSFLSYRTQWVHRWPSLYKLKDIGSWLWPHRKRLHRLSSGDRSASSMDPAYLEIKDWNGFKFHLVLAVLDQRLFKLCLFSKIPRTLRQNAFRTLNQLTCTRLQLCKILSCTAKLHNFSNGAFYDKRFMPFLVYFYGNGLKLRSLGSEVNFLPMRPPRFTEIYQTSNSFINW